MKDYYGTLNIDREATPGEIKKAYFALVRAFPPERHPAEFMRIREAYEVLVDENTRREYDQVGFMPSVVQTYFREGRKALEEGSVLEAIRLLEQIVKVYPNFSIVNSLLGDAYLKNENSGKAIRIFEELVAHEHHNAGFVRRLAHAYAMRGWYRKAIAHYHHALSLDEDNISLWLGLINCHLATNDFAQAQATVWEGLDVSNRKGWDNLELYYHIIQIDIYSRDLVNMKKHLAEMRDKAVEKEAEKAHIAWFLAMLAKKIHSIGLHEEAAATIDAAFALLPDNEELIKIKKDIDSQARVYLELKQLEKDTTIDSHLAEMLSFELRICNNQFCLECKMTQFTFEMDIIDALESFRGEISRLKNSYPALYDLKKEFFDNVLNRKKEGYLVDTYLKKLKKYRKLLPEKFEGEDDDALEFWPQPYRRTAPKVGRNDPCPCGSGKKYKKCCG